MVWAELAAPPFPPEYLRSRVLSQREPKKKIPNYQYWSPTGTNVWGQPLKTREEPM
jgi:hypothetical protein